MWNAQEWNENIVKNAVNQYMGKAEEAFQEYMETNRLYYGIQAFEYVNKAIGALECGTSINNTPMFNQPTGKDYWTWDELFDIKSYLTFALAF